MTSHSFIYLYFHFLLYKAVVVSASCMYVVNNSILFNLSNLMLKKWKSNALLKLVLVA